MIWHGCYDSGWQGLIVPEAFAHPAKFARGLVERIYDYLLSTGRLVRGNTVIDPFGGVALGGIIGASKGLRWVGCELEPRFVGLAEQNIALHRRTWEAAGDPLPRIVQGDSRGLSDVLGPVLAEAVVSSPPYVAALAQDNRKTPTKAMLGIGRKDRDQRPCEAAGILSLHGEMYGTAPGQLGAMPAGSVDGVLSSPLEISAPSDTIGASKPEATNDTRATKAPTGRKRKAAKGVRGKVEQASGRDDVDVRDTGHVDRADSGILRRELLDCSEGDEAARHQEQEFRAAAWQSSPEFQDGPAQPRLSEAGGKGPVQPMPVNGEAGSSPQERRPLRQPLGESGNPLQLVPHEGDETQVVGGEESRQAAAEVQRAGRVEPQADCIISSPPYANLGDGCQHGKVDIQKFTEPRARYETVAYRERDGYGSTAGQLAALPAGTVDGVVSSPPYATGDSAGPESLGRRTDGSAAAMLKSQGWGVGGQSSDGNLAALPAGTVDGVVSSPPYEGSIASNENVLDKMQERLRKQGRTRKDSAILRSVHGIGDFDTYTNCPGSLGGLAGQTFWQASRLIVLQCRLLLKPGGVAVWVTKDFVRNKQRVPFSDDWRRLCEACGFRMVEWIKASLVKETVENQLFGGPTTRRKERKSFFRRLAEKKGSPRIDHEDVLVMERL